MKAKSLGLVIILLYLLAGCSTTTQEPTSLSVTRSDSLPSYHFAPFERTVTNSTAVQQLYTAAMALPAIKPGAVYNCPADFGLVYHLSFQGDNLKYQHMDLEATGCEWLHLNQSETRITTDSFRSLVAQTFGLPCLLPLPFRCG